MRGFLLALPHVLEAEQFGGLIYWLGDKAIGGKMFAMLNPERSGDCISYPAGTARFDELLEREGLVPAPYLARAFWVMAERWDVWRNAEWEDELRGAHALTFAKLTATTQRNLQLSKTELKKVVAARKAVLAERAREKAARLV